MIAFRKHCSSAARTSRRIQFGIARQRSTRNTSSAWPARYCVESQHLKVMMFVAAFLLLCPCAIAKSQTEPSADTLSEGNVQPHDDPTVKTQHFNEPVHGSEAPDSVYTTEQRRQNRLMWICVSCN